MSWIQKGGGNKEKMHPKISHLIPPCLPREPANVSGFQVNAALNGWIISKRCNVGG